MNNSCEIVSNRSLKFTDSKLSMSSRRAFQDQGRLRHAEQVLHPNQQANYKSPHCAATGHTDLVMSATHRHVAAALHCDVATLPYSVLVLLHDAVVRRVADVNLAGKAMAFHARCHVDGVSIDREAGRFGTQNASHHGTRVNADADLHGLTLRVLYLPACKMTGTVNMGKDWRQAERSKGAFPG